MTGHLILGIDPGLNGAVALLDLVSGMVADVYDMPCLKMKTGRILDAYTLAARVDEFSADIADAWIERAWPRPGEGGVQGFAFGKNYGQTMGIVCAQFVPLHEVTPAAWKRAMKVSADKDEARQAASIRWPMESRRWSLKKHHGRAEACLIAAYGRRQFLIENRDLYPATRETANA